MDVYIDENVINKLDIGVENRAILLMLLNEQNPKNIEQTAKTIINKDERYLNDGGPDPRTQSIYDRIVCEVYKLLCTTNSRYRRERQQLKTHLPTVITTLAASIAAPLGTSLAIVSAVIAAVLMLIAKMGLNLFCDSNTGICR